MGRLVKNPGMTSNVGMADAGQMPGGTTGQRPASGISGQLRWNESTSAIEYWDGAAWQTVGKSGLVTVTKDTYTGTGAQTVFLTMSFNVVSATDILVFVGGVFQNPGVSYTVDGSDDITFTSAPPNGETIIILHGLNEVA